MVVVLPWKKHGKYSIVLPWISKKFSVENPCTFCGKNKEVEWLLFIVVVRSCVVCY